MLCSLCFSRVFVCTRSWFLETFGQDHTVYAFSARPLMLCHGAVEDARWLLTAAAQRRKKMEEEGDKTIEQAATMVGLIVHLAFLESIDPQRTAMPEAWQFTLASLEQDFNFGSASAATAALCDTWGGSIRRLDVDAEDRSG